MTVSSIMKSRLRYTESEEFDPIMMTRTQSLQYGSKSMDDNSLICSSDEDTIAIEETRDIVEGVRSRQEIRVIDAIDNLDELSSEGPFKHVGTPSHKLEEMPFGTNSDASSSMCLGDEETKLPGAQMIETDVLKKLYAVQSPIKSNIGTRHPHTAGLTCSDSKDAVEALLTDFSASFALSTSPADDSALIISRLDESQRTKDEPLFLKLFVKIVESMLSDEPMLEMRKSAAAKKT